MDDALRRSIVKAVCEVGDKFVATSDFGNAEECYRGHFVRFDKAAALKLGIGWVLQQFARFGSGLTADEVAVIHRMLTDKEEAAQLGQLLMLAASAWHASADSEAE